MQTLTDSANKQQRRAPFADSSSEAFRSNAPRSGPLARIFRAITILLAALGLLVVVVTFTPVDYWWATWLAGDSWGDPHGDVLVVLAGSNTTPETMGLDSYWRAVYANLVWHGDGFKTILISGGPADAPGALPIRDYIVSQGVPAGDIVLETQSRSTRENALYSQPILSRLPGTTVLLTSDYHVFRARRAFARAGVDLVPVAFPDVRKRYQQRRLRWDAFVDLCLETTKICYYKARGWL
jgi:uncharacterized SAM-binding protein YcdF (DUF218 family)